MLAVASKLDVMSEELQRRLEVLGLDPSLEECKTMLIADALERLLTRAS